MASGPHDPRSREWPPDDDGAPDNTTHTTGSQEPHPSPPTIQHSPPGPSDDRTRGLPLSSPWMSPPFAAPAPDEPDPPRPPAERRRPYAQPYTPATGSAGSGPSGDPTGPTPPSPPTPSGSPHGRGEEPEGGREDAGPAPRRRMADRPDRLVASGPPRRSQPPQESLTPQEPLTPQEAQQLQERHPPRRSEELQEPGEEFRRSRRPRPDRLVASGPSREQAPAVPPPGEDTGPEREEPGAPDDHDDHDDFEPVRRVGRPPGGRPARPDRLVASGPPRRRGPNGGRHHRAATAPSAVRRSTPTRRRRGRGLMIPFLLVLVLTAAVGGGLVLWGWVSSPFATGLRLVGDDFQSGDESFVSPIADGADGSSQVLNDLAAAGSTVVAVGTDKTDPVRRPLFLVSSDGGDTWRLGKVSGPVGQEAGPTTVGLVAGGDGRWLAAGNESPGVPPSLWTSADGQSWNPVSPEEAAGFEAGDEIVDLTRTSSGFVAVGVTVADDGTYGPAAWTSPDGRGWTRVRARDLDAPGGTRGLRAVAARGDAVVALAEPGGGKRSSTVLRSGDGGKSWLRGGEELDGVASQPGALAVAGNRFVAVPTQQGSAKGEVPVYCSANGGSWDRCGAITGLGPQGSGVKRLASSATGAFAVAESGLEHYVAFTSQDGRKWSPSTDLGTVSGSLRALAVSDEGTLVVGGDQRAIGVDNRLVLITAAREGAARAVPLDTIEGLNRVARETTGLAAGDGRFVAVGAASGDAGIWTSEDGEAWDTAGPARLLGGEHWQALSDVVYGRRGWLAVGSTMSAVAATEPLLVTSADGRSWRRVPIMDSLARGGHSLLAPRAVAAGPSGYVLAGEEGEPGATTAVLWFSADLKGYTRAARLPAGGAGVRLHDVSPTSSGYMAVGGSGTGEQETGVVWVSADGVNWTARKPLLPSGATAAGLRHVVTYGGQVVAVGTAETAQGRRAFGAVSRDNGATWRTAWLPADRAAAVLDLAATPDGVVAVGWHGVQGEGDSSAWTSEDGLSWQRHEPAEGRLAGEGAQWLGAVAVSGDQVVALGRSTTYDADHLTLWRSTLAAER
ncbi:hypothetical protein [Planobispora longispora]|uniref:Uncharacterized protein n=1 Tax=Planobispora longispora TaxID=28887 RepID=A0A8J3W725_9ACTN|nr:hypothetical protein [Planobispora longispora]GIH77416.1 hypothetical protein Plo01_38450 [Planobispora longispora]